MGRLRVLLAAVALMTPVASAFAADMPGTRPLPPPPPPTTFIERVSSGWYLRGDLGYRWGTLTGAQSTPPFPSPSTNSLGTAVLGGVGVGIKSDWLRTDVTLDVASSQRYRGTVATPDDVTARLSTISALFNGYLDLGSWYGFTPYIGAGVGASRVKVSDYSSTVVPITGADNSQWKFSWAGMAGLGYQVAPNMMVDLGYRYLNFGDVKTGADALGRQMTFRNVAAHEVRIGLRWSFDDIRRY